MKRYITALLSAVLTIAAAVLLALPAPAMNGDKIVVVLDAGHGGIDGGTDAGARTEKTYNLLIATYLRDYLSADGRFDVYLTREDDSYSKFLPRVLIAKDHNADLFLSLHCNSSDADYVNGVEAYTTVVDEFAAYTLSDKILTNINKAVGIAKGEVKAIEDTGDELGIYYWNDERQWDMPSHTSLGQKSDYYSVNTWCSKFGIPSIIVEHGYLTNETDAKIIDKDENLKKIAKAEADALIDYYFNHTHAFPAERTTDFPSSCTLDGQASYRCTVCSAKTATTALSANPDGHYYRKEEEAEPTCTEDGYINWICQIAFNLDDKGLPCTVHRYTEALPAPGHDYATLEDTQPGHGFDGVLRQKCTRCGDEKEDIRPGEPHNFVLESDTPADCENDGKTVNKCTVCGQTEEVVTPAAGHSYTEKERVEATDSEDGYILYTCSSCGKEKKEILSTCEHDFTESTTPPTCTEPGLTEKSCKICGRIYKEEIPAVGHKYETQMEVNPTCTEDGYKREKCAVCGDVNTTLYSATPHSYNLDETTGKYICKFCGNITDSLPGETTKSRFFSSPVAVTAGVIIVIQVVFCAVMVAHAKAKAKKRQIRRNLAHFSYDEEEESDYSPDNYDSDERGTPAGIFGTSKAETEENSHDNSPENLTTNDNIKLKR